jgi:hypothetical protein
MHPKCSSSELLGFSIHRAQAAEYGVTITQQAKQLLQFSLQYIHTKRGSLVYEQVAH